MPGVETCGKTAISTLLDATGTGSASPRSATAVNVRARNTRPRGNAYIPTSLGLAIDTNPSKSAISDLPRDPPIPECRVPGERSIRLGALLLVVGQSVLNAYYRQAPNDNLRAHIAWWEWSRLAIGMILFLL